MNDTLHQEPERDQFKTESPIRAFTSWTVQGRYALGKGFRPSLAHVIPYLNAMEAKEGWQIVQVLEADTQTPSFLFRQSYVVPDDVLIERLRGDDGFEEAGWKMDRARAMSDSTTMERTEIGGKWAFKLGIDPEKRHHTLARWTANIEMLKKAMFGMKRDVLKKFLDKEMVLDRAMYWETASVASVLRLIDRLEYWDHIALADCITEAELGKVLGRKFHPNDPALAACTTDIYKAMADMIYQDQPLGETHIPAAERFSDDVDPASRDPLPPIEAIVEDDPINPKHYGGTACAEIGELLSANSYQVLKYNWRLLLGAVRRLLGRNAADAPAPRGLRLHGEAQGRSNRGRHCHRQGSTRRPLCDKVERRRRRDRQHCLDPRRRRRATRIIRLPRADRTDQVLRHLRTVLEYDQERGIRGALSMWWIICGVVVLVYVFAFACCKVAARADEAWERLVNELELPRKERDDP